MILAASPVIRQATRDPVSRPLRAAIWAGLSIYAPTVTVLSCWASIMRSISLMADCCNSALTGASFLLAASLAAAHAASHAAAHAASHAASLAASHAASHAASLAAALAASLAASHAAALAASHAASHAAALAASIATAHAASASIRAASIGPLIDGTCLSEVISGRAARASA